MPLLAEVAAAADVADRVDDAAVEEADAIRVELRVRRRAVGAVGRQEHRGLAVGDEALAVDDRDRNARAVCGCRVPALGGVAQGIVAAEDLVLLQELALAGRHVEVVDRGRRRERLVVEAQLFRLELEVVRDVGRVDRLREVDAVRAARREVSDAQPRQAVLALREDAIVGKDVDVLDHHVAATGEHLLPVRLPRVGDGRGDDPEVPAVLVRADVEEGASVVHVVLVVLLARGDQAQGRRRLVGREPAPFARGEGGNADEENRLAARAPGEHPEHLVLLLIEEDVGRRVGAEGVPVEPVRALGRVGDRVEERLVVGRPGHRGRSRDLLREELAGRQVLDVQRVVAEARVVGRVGEQVPVVADVARRDRHELLAFRKGVDVEVDLLLPLEAALLAAVDRILLALLSARVVEPSAVPVGHREIGFLDPPEHLVVERLLEPLRRLHECAGVRVLGLEERADLRVVLLSHPEVVVLQGLVVQRLHVGHLLRDRRRRVAGEHRARWHARQKHCCEGDARSHGLGAGAAAADFAKSPALTIVIFAGSRYLRIAARICSAVRASTFFSRAASQARVRLM